MKENTRIVDGLAICDLSETGVRSNGYLITAIAGSQAIACCVIHGYIDGSIDDPNRPALGASFYANSFREEGNPYDLSLLSTLINIWFALLSMYLAFVMLCQLSLVKRLHSNPRPKTFL